MPYTEYSTQSSGNIRGNLSTYNSITINKDSNRFTCNNSINSGNVEQAIKTYKKIYDIYSTKPFRDCVKEHSTFNTNDCQSQSNTCPSDATSAGNLFYSLNRCTPNRNEILSVQDLDVYLDDCGANIREYNNNSTTTHSYDSAEDLKHKFDSDYKSLLETRSDLDNKMNELLGNNRNSILYEKQNQLDASVYTTIIWTVLVTSSLYYIFTKI
jgi:hypothetical protein